MNGLTVESSEVMIKPVIEYGCEPVLKSHHITDKVPALQVSS